MFYIVAGLILIIIVILLFRKKTRPLKSSNKLQSLKERLVPLDPRIEELNFYTDQQGSYTIHKKDIFICLKGEDGKLPDDNFLTYIAIHEISHALVPGDTSDHPPSFQREFKTLLGKATERGLYDPSIPFPRAYCSKSIESYRA